MYQLDNPDTEDRIPDYLASLLRDPEMRALVRAEIEALDQPLPELRPRNGNGRLDARNPLNDLTGAEWVFFLNSVETTAYPTTGPQGYAHDLRKTHPSPKPPQLMEKIARFFTKKGQWVLDPFAGVGGTLLGAALAGRHALGIDLEPRYLDTYRAVCEREDIAMETVIAGDSRDIVNIVRSCDAAPPKFDLILTDPPYGDMLARAQTGENKKRTGRSEATPFTDSPEDLGNLPLDAFLAELTAIIADAATLLKTKGHVIVFCKDLQPTKDRPNLLHADVVNALAGIEGLSFKGYKIWHDKTVTLYPFGYPFSFVANQLHQFILVFRKEPAAKPARPRTKDGEA
jgi:DNA modification methylase